MTMEDLKDGPFFAEWFTSHKVFERLSAIERFYDVIFNTSCGFTHIPLVGKLINTESVIFPSMKGTIESISTLLKKGHCNDAFALIRKFSDAIVIDTYKSIIIDEIHNQAIDVNVPWAVIANNKVNKWISSKSPLMEEHPKKELQKISATFPQIIKILKLDSKEKDSLYNKIRTLCNDNMHYNSLCFFLWNDPNYLRINKKTAMTLLNNVYSCVTFLSSLHFAFIYNLHPEYFTASDYSDYLDVGQQPPLGSERWIASYFQDFFTKVVYPYNKKLGKYLVSLDLMDLKYGTEQTK